MVICIFLKFRCFKWDEMDNKMDSLSLSVGNEMTRQRLPFLSCGSLYAHILHSNKRKYTFCHEVGKGFPLNFERC